MNLKFSPNLFLEVIELQKFKESLDLFGFRKNILENTASFGLIKNQKSDPNFDNGLVERDVDSGGDKTIKVRELSGIDSDGAFIHQDATFQIVVPNDSQWHWVKVSHQFSNTENGTFTISTDGTLIGDGNAELLSILRGQPNFPSRVKFVNSTNNTLEYEVLEVTDDQTAILQHPALDGSSLSLFVPETDLQIKIVGTFTPGVVVPIADKYIFEYDSTLLQLVQEITPNTPPAFTQDKQFYLARIKRVGADVVIQDKRLDYWEPKGAQEIKEISIIPNPLIGVENIKFDDGSFATGAENLLEISWGMRSDNWSVDTSLNIVTLSSGLGGKFKSTNDFTDGDFDGWRVYTQNGNYAKVTSSVKQGTAINLLLDVLDVTNYSDDGGLTFNTTEFVLVVPDADSINLLCIPTVSTKETYQKEFSFPINTLVGRLKLLVYADPTCTYAVSYRHKSFKSFSEYTLLTQDSGVGYYDETSFDSNGVLEVDPGNRNRKTYTTSIELINGANSFFNFKIKVDTGDLFGVQKHTTFPAVETVLAVGTAKMYHYFSGAPSLSGVSTFKLDKVAAKEGNQFIFHIECTDITLNGHTIQIVEDDGASPDIVQKDIVQGDVYHMRNIEGGLKIIATFDGTNWVLSQNYDKGRPGEIITLDGVQATLFDVTGKGQVKGLFGHNLCNGQNGTPDLRQLFIVGAGDNPAITTSSGYSVGDQGGSEEHTLAANELPEHFHPYQMRDDDDNDDDDSGFPETGNGSGTPRVGNTDVQTTTGDAHENRPPFIAFMYAKKFY